MNTKPTSIASRELLSALADGELRQDELTLVLASCSQDSNALESWNSFQIVGNVLRNPAGAFDQVSQGASPIFLDKLKLRLAQEPALRVPPLASFSTLQNPTSPISVPTPAANDSLFRWKMVAGFASLAAVSVIALNSFSTLSTAPVIELAQSTQAPSEQVLIASPQGNIVRDARFEELLAAHRQMGGTSALQVPSGFLRNATFEAQHSGSR